MRDFFYNLATDQYKGLVAGVIKAFLFILSVIYGLIVRSLIVFYQFRPCRLASKVISVGNITLGGTGKTSLVEYIARYLKLQNHKIAILTRGYGKRKAQNAQRTAQYESMGDEPFMLQKNLEGIPVIVNANRIKAAKAAKARYGVDAVILDDGFQQWRLKKDLEIVCIDTTDPFGNRQLIPRGILREPLSSLKRADIFILTKTNLNPDFQDIKDFLIEINPRALIVESGHQPKSFYSLDQPEELWSTDILKGETVAAFSGIADPDSFENLLQSLGIRMGASFRFADHHRYTQSDLEKTSKSCQEKNIKTLVTTEKDAVRLQSLKLTGYSLKLLVLRIELKVTKNEEEFHNRLLKLYRL